MKTKTHLKSNGPVWIHRSGDEIVVELEAWDGSWVEVIREQVDENYSHIIEISPRIRNETDSRFEMRRENS